MSIDLSQYTNNYSRLDEETRGLWETASEKIVSANEQSIRRHNLHASKEKIGFSPAEESCIFDQGADSYIMAAEDDNESGKLAKIFFGPNHIKNTEKYLTALHIARNDGVKKVPEPLAINENILVMRECDGLDLEELSGEIKHITKNQLIELFQTFDNLIRLRLESDFIADSMNIIYDIDEGFTILDFTYDTDPIVKDLEKIVNENLRPYFRDELDIGELFEKAYTEYKQQRDTMH